MSFSRGRSLLRAVSWGCLPLWGHSDDKSLPVSGLSPAYGSMPLSACHRRPVCPVNRQQINPSQQNHTLSWCSSLCSHWWILHTPVHKPFLNFSKILKPSFYCWGKAANENRSKQWYWILARLLSPGRRFFQHFMRETRSAHYEFWVYDCSAFLPRPPDTIWLTLKRGRKMLEKSSLFCRVDKGFHNIHIPSCTENTQKV